MNFIKKNFKLIIGLLIEAVLISGITVYAYSYVAKDISYTKPGINTVTNVEQALNDLYTISSTRKNINYEIWGSGLFTCSSSGVAKTKTFSVNEGIKKVTIYVSVCSSYGPLDPSVSGDIISKQVVTNKSSGTQGGKFASGYYEIILETNGKAGNVTLNISIAGSCNGNTADAIIIYES